MPDDDAHMRERVRYHLLKYLDQDDEVPVSILDKAMLFLDGRGRKQDGSNPTNATLLEMARAASDDPLPPVPEGDDPAVRG